MSRKKEVNKELTLNTPVKDLEKKLLQENNIDNMKNIVELFNLNIKKKDIIRVNRLNDLQDKITNQIEERLDKHADEFSNGDLINYFKTLQDTINKADVSTDNIKAPTIQINQQINVNNSELDIESKRKVADAVTAILKKLDNKQSIAEEVIDAEFVHEEEA